MKYISFLIKPASSLCNMRCRYCFYYDVASHRSVSSYGIMQEDTMQALIDKALALDKLADITFAFQGGEPTMAGIAYFYAFTSYVETHKQKQRIHYALQSNGISINDKWCALFKKYQFLIGISMDGYRELHNYMRQSEAYGDTFDTVMQTIANLQKWQIEYNVLSVLTSHMAKHPQKVFNFFKKQQIRYVQFIPCLPGLKEERTTYSLQPAAFASFYKTYFDLWYREYEKGNYMSITLFDNVILMFRGIQPQQCGMTGQCVPQFVVEADGQVYPCDFYVLDTYACGNMMHDSLTDMVRHKKMHDFLSEPRRFCKKCADCQFEMLCHRNCKRQNITYYSENYCGYRDFLEYAQERMVKIAKQIR